MIANDRIVDEKQVIYPITVVPLQTSWNGSAGGSGAQLIDKQIGMTWSNKHAQKNWVVSDQSVLLYIFKMCIYWITKISLFSILQCLSCVKILRIHFLLVHIFSYSVWIRKNTDQKKVDIRMFFSASSNNPSILNPDLT